MPLWSVRQTCCGRLVHRLERCSDKAEVEGSTPSPPTFVMIEVRKKPKETTQALIRRFSSIVRMSGILEEAKKRQYYQPPLNERAKKEKALKKLKKLKSKI